MTDRRLTPANGRVAHVSLRGEVAAERYTEGERRRVCRPVAAIRDDRRPRARLRELILHEVFVVLEERDGWAFGFAARDGYVGHVRADDLGPELWQTTHVVTARQSYLVEEPVLKTDAEISAISFGTRLSVMTTHEDGRWGEVAVLRAPGEEEGHKRTSTMYVPMAHLAPVNARDADPVTVAERFLGTPYLWGGNSGFGIDCSGLVQAALMACGVDCPGDSDMQAALGDEAEGAPERGDLLFWKGHVAIVVGADRLIHANAHHMAVAHEGIEAARRRIEAQGEGAVIAHRRIARPPERATSLTPPRG
ncbi:C40 family peptidase [Sinisalibacter lacisalsi]|uniref:NlpC/P60 domain-containing protein n=1 Tax=Sinisalibacter lacisalsi TaxID=1526570 RepID=A0ABQ1QCQ6_9RHOB|nr:C40 family peptidase [Sinisalibacter lacisalsi]GGD23274.1 hypothetical protein GCM10011358_04710 [Sinisalibacter lacisalsi]